MKLTGPLLLVIFLTFCCTTSASQRTGNGNLEAPTHGLCEPITIPLCANIGYNQTFMPNMLGHETQRDAGLDVQTYHPLVKIACSPQLNLFLCALFLPVCTILTEPVPPCKSVCIAARDGCSALMNKFGHDWPEHMQCDKFPEAPDLCVGPEQSSSNSNLNPTPQPPKYNTEDYEPIRPQNTVRSTQRPGKDSTFSGIGSGSRYNNKYGLPTYQGSINYTCPRTWAVEPKLKYQLQLDENYPVANCGLRCHNVMFTEKQEMFARYWIGVWAILCFVSTLFTVLTFLIDMRRFRYPERPIIFISGCYLVISLCFVVGFVLEDRASCVTAKGGELLVTQGTKNEGCTILFMLTYFFIMASSIWWVILTLTWVLAAGLKWGHEAIESNSQYFHLAAWAIPAIKTITIIALGSIDGDILSGK